MNSNSRTQLSQDGDGDNTDEDVNNNDNNSSATPTTTPTTTNEASSSSFGPTCLLLVCLVPATVGLALVFGMLLLPTLLLACVGLAVLCVLSALTTGGSNQQQQEGVHTSVDTNVNNHSSIQYTRLEIEQGLVAITAEQVLEQQQHSGDGSTSASGAVCDICLVDLVLKDVDNTEKQGRTTAATATTTTSPSAPTSIALAQQQQELAASPNPHCKHVFHRECITTWLLKNPTCPCCRAPYLGDTSAIADGGTLQGGATPDVGTDAGTGAGTIVAHQEEVEHGAAAGEITNHESSGSNHAHGNDSQV